jgi:hypothetical protein
MGQQIPDVAYTPEENRLWQQIYEKLTTLHQHSMSERFLKQSRLLNKELNISGRIPQLNELSAYLQSRTGFRIKPTHGILSQREFLNAFAFKIFCSTQYLRNVKNPDYTPEPDIVHEFVGHVPMFADPAVAVSLPLCSKYLTGSDCFPSVLLTRRSPISAPFTGSLSSSESARRRARLEAMGQGSRVPSVKSMYDFNDAAHDQQCPQVLETRHLPGLQGDLPSPDRAANLPRH